MSRPYVIKADGSRVEAWSSVRLPFEPKGWLKELRAELGDAVRALQGSDDEMLSAALAAPDEPGSWDIENVLFYNVGTGCFASAARRGVRFERSFNTPKPPSALNGRVAAYHRYEMAPSTDAFQYRWLGEPVARWDGVALPVGPELTATAVWAAMARSEVSVTAAGNLAGERFALKLRLRGPERLARSTVALLKPLVDGVVASFHAHDGTALDDVVHRLAVPLKGARHLDSLLMNTQRAPLGERRLLWPRGTGVQWNPADDLCVACQLTFEPAGAKLALDGELLRVDPGDNGRSRNTARDKRRPAPATAKRRTVPRPREAAASSSARPNPQQPLAPPAAKDQSRWSLPHHGVRELRTLQDFRNARHAGRHVIVIADQANAGGFPIAHHPSCPMVTEDSFKTKVLKRRGATGRYWRAANVETAMEQLKARLCGHADDLIDRPVRARTIRRGATDEVTAPSKVSIEAFAARKSVVPTSSRWRCSKCGRSVGPENAYSDGQDGYRCAKCAGWPTRLDGTPTRPPGAWQRFRRWFASGR